jgi:hypothetical protein
MENNTQQWLSFINDSDNNPKLRSYRYKLFKNNFKLENYLLIFIILMLYCNDLIVMCILYFLP